MKKWWVGFAVVFHFTIFTLGMLGIHAHRDHWVEKTHYWYSRVTGVGGSFGFFSPNIGRQVVVRFDVERAGGEVFETTLEEATAPEVHARMGNMIRFFSKNYKNNKLARSLSASLTAAVFKRYPDAVSVTFKAYVHILPAMDQYVQGSPIEFKQFYTAKFSKDT